MLKDIYDKSMILDASMEWLCDVILVDQVSISNRLKGIEEDRKYMLKGIDIDTYDMVRIGLNAGEDSKNKLGEILRDSFMSLVRSGALRTTACVSVGCLEYITPFDWAFLEIDFQKACATGDGKRFAQIRVIQNFELSERELSFLEDSSCKIPKGDFAPFKKMPNLTAACLTVRLLSKDDKSLPDRLEISARDVKRIVFCVDFGLINKKTGIMNRAGMMLVALSKNTTPQNIKAPDQAMKELRNVFRDIGIMDKDPFQPKRAGWKPKFTLIDGVDKADKRAKGRAIHVLFDDSLQYNCEGDKADEWLLEHDKKTPS